MGAIGSKEMQLVGRGSQADNPITFIFENRGQSVYLWVFIRWHEKDALCFSPCCV